MTGTGKITDRILQEAKGQADAILKEAEEQAAAAKVRAAKSAKAQAEDIQEHAKKDSVEINNRIMAVWDLRNRKQLLGQKRAVLDEAFAKAGEAFSALDDERFVSIYHRLVLEAVQKGDEGIAPSAADARRINATFVSWINTELSKRRIPANIRLLPPRSDLLGGCAVVSGDMEINLSIKSVLEAVRERAEGEVASQLFAFMEG